MKLAPSVLFSLLLACSVVTPARADDEACFRAAVEGQKLQRAGKLLDARERFVACAQRACDAAAVVDKCAGWLHEVEVALPSLTLAVLDAGGHDVIARAARIDDADASAALGGRSIPLDPGPHRVTVEVAGTTLTENVLVRQGEKDRSIVFHVPSAGLEAVEARAPTPGRGLLAGAIAAGGVAAISTVLFGVFGARGVSDRSTFGCATGCAADHYTSVHQDFVIADASLGVAIGSAVIMTVLFGVRARALADPPSAPRSSRILTPAGLAF
jgi:hypothetical protein